MLLTRPLLSTCRLLKVCWPPRVSVHPETTISCPSYSVFVRSITVSEVNVTAPAGGAAPARSSIAARARPRPARMPPEATAFRSMPMVPVSPRSSPHVGAGVVLCRSPTVCARARGRPKGRRVSGAGAVRECQAPGIHALRGGSGPPGANMLAGAPGRERARRLEPVIVIVTVTVIALAMLGSIWHAGRDRGRPLRHPRRT